MFTGSKPIRQGQVVTDQLEGLQSGNWNWHSQPLGTTALGTTNQVMPFVMTNSTDIRMSANSGGSLSLNDMGEVKKSKKILGSNNIRASMGTTKTYEDFAKFLEPRPEAVYVSAKQISQSKTN